MQQAQNDPSVVLILGGSRARELAAVRAAVTTIPSARIVVLSSGALALNDLEQAISDAGGRKLPCVADRTALDTVTNFTSLAAPLAAAGAKCVAVATDAAHSTRAIPVGRIILGWYGIRTWPLIVQSVEVPVADPSETRLRTVRDVLRALLWVLIGFDGSTLAARVHPSRAADVRAWRDSKQGGGHDAARAGALSRALTAALARGDHG